MTLILEITNPESLTLSSAKDLVPPSLRITLRTSLPKLSLAPVLRDPHIAVGIDSAIVPAGRGSAYGNLVAATVKGDTDGGIGARHVQVLLAEGVDGVDDAPVLFQAGEFVDCPVPFGFCDGRDGEEEGAEGCD